MLASEVRVAESVVESVPSDARTEATAFISVDPRADVSIDSLLFNFEVSSIHCLDGDAELEEAEPESEDDEGEIDTSADVLLDLSDDNGTVSAEEEELVVGTGEGDSEPGREVTMGPEEEPFTELDEVKEELSHPPQTVSPGIQTVVMVVDTIVLVVKVVLGVPVAVDKTGLIVQEIQSDGRPDGT